MTDSPMTDSPLPAPSYPAPPAPPPPAPERPGALTAAAALLIVTGVMVILVALLVALCGAMLGNDDFRRQVEEQLDAVLAEAVIPFLITLAGVLGLYGIASVVAGIYVLPGRAWARITGLIVAVLGALMALLFVFSGEPFFVVTSLGFLASYVFSAWALIARAAWFTAR